MNISLGGSRRSNGEDPWKYISRDRIGDYTLKMQGGVMKQDYIDQAREALEEDQREIDERLRRLRMTNPQDSRPQELS